jgi:hypothetical protein
MQEEIHRLIQAGLYQDNLQEITRLSRQRFFDAPALLGTLIFICESLSNEYDNQAIPVDRYRLILESLQPAFLRLLEAETEPPDVFVEALNAIYKQFGILRSF